jgi:hypothetical protein
MGISAMKEDPQKSKFSRFLSFWSEEHSLSMMLTFLTLQLFLLTPAGFISQFFKAAGSLFMCLTLASGLITMVKPGVLRLTGTVIVVGVVLFKSADLFFDVQWLSVGDTLLTLLSLSLLIYIVFLQIIREGPVTAHRIRGAIAEYLLIGLLFAFLYGLIAELAPGAFIIPQGLRGSADVNAEAFYYFSIVTLTTVGYGDITAVHPFVRSLVMIEALIGQLYPTILIARLVTMELETRRSRTGGS